MKDQYFGDINDYRKYGILRCFAKAGWDLGVCWMLTANDGRSDGRKIEYLKNKDRWRPHDPLLFDTLEAALRKRKRDLGCAEEAGFLPQAQFFRDVVPKAVADRKRWIDLAVHRLAKSNLVFFDPDNGIEVPSTPPGRKDSSKFVYWAEIAAFWSRGKSVLIFQHFAREKRDSYIARTASALSTKTSGSSVRCLRTANVLFLLAHRSSERDKADRAMKSIESSWKGQAWECYRQNASELT